jgi:hypothetical protein
MPSVNIDKLVDLLDAYLAELYEVYLDVPSHEISDRILHVHTKLSIITENLRGLLEEVVEDPD